MSLCILSNISWLKNVLHWKIRQKYWGRRSFLQCLGSFRCYSTLYTYIILILWPINTLMPCHNQEKRRLSYMFCWVSVLTCRLVSFYAVLMWKALPTWCLIGSKLHSSCILNKILPSFTHNVHPNLYHLFGLWNMKIFFLLSFVSAFFKISLFTFHRRKKVL